jgi:hypothetical protein
MEETSVDVELVDVELDPVDVELEAPEAATDGEPVVQATCPRPRPAASATAAAVPARAPVRSRRLRATGGGGGVSYGSKPVSVIASPPSTPPPWGHEDQ